MIWKVAFAILPIEFLVLLLTFVMVFALAACGSDKDEDDDDDRKSRTEENEDDDDDDGEKSSKKDKTNDKNDDDEKPAKDDDEKPAKESKNTDSLDGTWHYAFDASELLAEELGFFCIDIYFAFDENNKTMTMYADTDSIVNQLKDVMIEYMYDNFEKEGYSREEADTVCEQAYGVTVEGLVDSMLPELATSFDQEFAMSGTYKTDGNKLYFAENGEDFGDYIIYEVDGDELMLDDANGAAMIPEAEIPLPMYLNKVD